MSANEPQIRIGEWISEGWKMFTEQWKGWLSLSGGFFVMVVVPMGAALVFTYVMIFTSMAAHPRSSTAPPEIPIATIATLYLSIFGLLILLMPLTVFLVGGAYKAAFKQLRGEQIGFRDLFSARDCYWRLLGATIVHSVLVAIGMMLCIIPAFLVAGLFFFTLPLIVERDMGVFEAMKASRELTNRKLFMFTIFAVLVQIIASIGSQACYVGLLATWPLTFTISAVAYRDCFGVAGARRFTGGDSTGQAGYGAAPPSAVPGSTEQKIVCPSCNGSLPSTARFCYHCGANLSA